MTFVKDEIVELVMPYIEDYKYATVLELQKQNSKFDRLVNKYGYGQIRAGMNQSFAKIYHQSKRDWLRQTFYEKLTPEIEKQITNKYLETLSPYEAAKFANQKFIYLAKLHKFSPHKDSANHNLWSVIDLFKHQYHTNIRDYLLRYPDVMMQTLLAYSKLHSAKQTIRLFKNYTISSELLHDIAYHQIKIFSNSYEYLLQQALICYLMHDTAVVKQKFPSLKLSDKLLSNLFITTYGMRKLAFLCSSFKRYVRYVYTDKAKMFYSNWIFSDSNTLPIDHIKTKKYDFICKHCNRVYSVTISRMFNDTNAYYEKCPYCTSSKYSYGERIVNSYLTAANIKFDSQYSVRINGKLHKFDFYLPDKETLIEYQGTQHFEQVDYFTQHHNHRTLAKQKQLDYVKRQFASNHNLKFIAIDGRNNHYNTLAKITKLLNLIFNLQITDTEVRKSYYYRTKIGDFYYHDIDIAKYAIHHTIKQAAYKFNTTTSKVSKLCEALSLQK